MDKVIERQTYVSIDDKDGNPLLSRSLLEKDSKIIHDKKTGSIEIFNKEGQRIWHSIIPDDAKIQYQEQGHSHSAVKDKEAKE